jgi:hypothetical protein
MFHSYENFIENKLNSFSFQKEPANAVGGEKLTVRQLNGVFVIHN